MDVTDWRESASDPRTGEGQSEILLRMRLWSRAGAGDKSYRPNLCGMPIWSRRAGKLFCVKTFARTESATERQITIQQARRAQRIDLAVQAALNDNLPVRVIILDGNRRDKSSLDTKPSSVKFRELDPEPWTITRYDRTTGAELGEESSRGAMLTNSIWIKRTTRPERREHIGSAFVRDPAVRRRAPPAPLGDARGVGWRAFAWKAARFTLRPTTSFH